MLRRLVPIFIAVGALLATPLAAQKVNLSFKGWIADQAGVLSDDFEIETKPRLRAIRDETGVAVILVTIPGMPGVDASVFAERIGKRLEELGAVGEERIVIMLLPDARVFTFAFEFAVGEDAKAIFQTYSDAYKERMLKRFSEVFGSAVDPYFKDDRWEDGMRAGVDAVERHLSNEALDAPPDSSLDP